MMNDKRRDGFVSYADLCYEKNKAEERGKEISHIFLTNESLQKMRNKPDVTLGSSNEVGTFDGITIYVSETNTIVYENGDRNQL